MANFWRTVPPKAVNRIFSGNSGNARVMALYREVQGGPISRDRVQDGPAEGLHAAHAQPRHEPEMTVRRMVHATVTCPPVVPRS